ncbi:hypothetical protein BASA81_014057 [Batrachochytrium salamandrivorans]|nr:hypothetical protein BASA81_014057 [Batrachochytrium salamandrivorans]
MPKFFAKLSATRKEARYPIDPQYSVSASATASVSGEAKVAIGPQLALNIYVFGLSVPKTAIEMQVAAFMDFSVKGRIHKKIISDEARDVTATLTALASVGIGAGISASLLGINFDLYTSPVLKVFTKEYTTPLFNKPPAEIASRESAMRPSTQANKPTTNQPTYKTELTDHNSSSPTGSQTTTHSNAHIFYHTICQKASQLHCQTKLTDNPSS